MKLINKIIIAALFTLLLNLSGLAGGLSSTQDTLPFTCGELLGRPTANSVTVHACSNRDLDVYFEYGTDSLNFGQFTTVKRCIDSIPFTEVLGNLSPNTQYYYRMRYREPGMTNFFLRETHSFRTQRAKGTTFTFAVEADPHMDTNSIPAVYSLTLQNILAKKPDFLIDLGDTFMSEKLVSQTQTEIIKRHLLLREYFDATCHSIPLYLVLGNHDGELGWRVDGTATSLPALATNTRKLYYPNPEPDAFYSGNSIPEPLVGLRQNYYAWEWGDALFIVIDPYWYTKSKPGWGWTLGAAQYNWFKQVLTNSNAKFKFVFSHQLVGGNGNDARGGAEFAGFFEMGGLNLDSTWGFTISRPGWEKPIHTLMVENNVSIFFHGHDHFYGRQEKDGVIYQEVPQPSTRSFTNLSATQYGYVEGVFLPSRGYLLLTVNDTSAKVEYIRTYLPSEENSQRHNGDIGHSYTIIKGPTSVEVEPPGVPSEFMLHQNYPNPFSSGSLNGGGETVIRYDLPVEGHVSLKVYNVLGIEVTTLTDEFQRSGTHEYRFSGTGLPSGIYFYRLSSGAFSATKRMLLLK